MIPAQKHLFDLPHGVTYLNCCYMSPQLLSVTEAGRQALQRKARPWNITVPDFFEESEETRGLFSKLVEAEPDDIAFVPSASYGIAVAARNLKVEKNSKIIMLQEQFPSNVLTWEELAKEQGAETLFLEDRDQTGWTRRVLDVLDERTAVLALPQVHWKDGRLIDLEAVGKRCRELGTALVLDLTQSAGAVPFSVKSVQPDFMVASTYKWLLGPYSMGFLYVNPRRQQGIPIEHNWINRRNSEDFAGLVEYQQDFQGGARRFDVGERSNFMLMPMVLAALKQILAWQVRDIAATLQGLTQRVAEGAEELGLLLPDLRQRAPHFLGLGFPAGVPGSVLEDLKREQVHVSVRGDSMRVSPHLFNSGSDVDKLFDVLRERIH